jgi:hypothetical protein
MDNQVNILEMDLQIDSTSESYLNETAKWGTFLSILGFIMSGIIAIVALFAGKIYGNAMRGIGNQGLAEMGTVFITIVYLIFAVVNFFMSFYLFKFSKAMKVALNLHDQESLIDALRNQRNMYRLIGILTAIYFGFILLAFLFGILASAFR